MTKDQILKLTNFGYHLRLATQNLEELIKTLPSVPSEETKMTTKGKKEAPKEEMEEVESPYTEKKPAKGGKKAPKIEEPEAEEEVEGDDEFDFDEAEIEDEVTEPEFTEADARTAMTTYAKKHSKEKALAILGKFAKTKKIADVPPAKLGALIAALKIGK